MNPDKRYQLHLCTMDALVNTIAAVVHSVDNPEAGAGNCPKDVQHKVATSISKHLSTYVKVGE